MVRIDMDMPKSCMECDYCYKTNIGSVCMNGDHYEYVDRYTESRHPGCPLIDVKKGEWIEREVICDNPKAIVEWQSAKCSVCGRYHTTPYMYYFQRYNYCPNCGADMREDRR